MKGYLMLLNKIPQLTVPLFPLLHPDEIKPQKSNRLRPEKALDLRKMIEELEKSRLITLNIEGKPWSVITVYSPYSPDIHVMVMETSSGRYLPGPESVPDSEGNKLMEVWASILDFIAQREENETIHLGYNWSPYSWGEEEEKTGFQSIPTKWHAMNWGWPRFPENNQTSEYVKFIDSKALPEDSKRLLGNNEYAEPLGQLIKERLIKSLPEQTLLNSFSNDQSWKTDGRGLCIPLQCSIQEMLRRAEFYYQILKPISQVLKHIFEELTKSITTLNYKDMDKILFECENGPLNEQNMKKLREAPVLRSIEEIKNTLKEKDIPEIVLKGLIEPIQKRCSESGNRSDWWRKGFGYALVFSSVTDISSGELRIMPGVFVGPGGVVEAQGVILKRPLDRQVSLDDIRAKSDVLWQLTDFLKDRFVEY
jgi:hypothetical protein